MPSDGPSVRAFVGVSGFSYPAWKGRFYPDELKSEDFLSYYSGKLGSVEINSSFYAAPGQAMVKGWAAKTNEGFRFSFKAPRLITHIMKLGEGSQEQANKLSATLGLLGRRRGPILFQLPPFTKFSRELLDGFLSRTSGIEPKVFEFRNRSWFTEATYDLLEEHGAGFCISETEDMEPTFKVTGGIAYFRLRKDSYDEKSVAKWGAKISEVSRGADECYVYLRHDETGENALLAQRLAQRLAGA
jgi:uncharacterized protein YecE (DUF72 family)